MNGNHENDPPSIARHNAQLRQVLRDSDCRHDPRDRVAVEIAELDAMLTYCRACDNLIQTA